MRPIYVVIFFLIAALVCAFVMAPSSCNTPFPEKDGTLADDDTGEVHNEQIDGGSQDDNAGTYSDILLDDLGGGQFTIIISYRNETAQDLDVAMNNQQKSYRAKAEEDWTIEIAHGGEDDAGMYISSAFNSNGTIGISHLAFDPMVQRDELVLTTGMSGSWSSEVVDENVGPQGGFTSLAVGPDGSSFISYIAINPDPMVQRDELAHAENVGGSWNIESADNTINGTRSFTSLVLDAAGNSHISYFGPGDAQGSLSMKIASNVGGSWSNVIVDTPGAPVGKSAVEKAIDDSVGFTSMYKGTGDSLHIAYSHPAFGTGLRYATNESGQWMVLAVDETASTGGYPSIVLDDADNAYISYYDAAEKALMYATNRSGNWIKAVVATGTDVGRYTSIALDSHGNVYVSYYGDYALWVATFPETYTGVRKSHGDDDDDNNGCCGCG